MKVLVGREDGLPPDGSELLLVVPAASFAGCQPSSPATFASPAAGSTLQFSHCHDHGFHPLPPQPVPSPLAIPVLDHHMNLPSYCHSPVLRSGRCHIHCHSR